MPHWVAEIWFLVFGTALLCTGAALLTDFRGWGRHWEDRLNARNAYVGKILDRARMPRPYVGPVWRPAAGVFAVALGLAMIAAVLSGAMR
jgi:hypothetical protein